MTHHYVGQRKKMEVWSKNDDYKIRSLIGHKNIWKVKNCDLKWNEKMKNIVTMRQAVY